MENKIWAYLIHLSANMWHDEGSRSNISPFEHELSCDDATWREVVDFLPSCGINTLVIDVGDGILYESHPELNIKGAWSKDKMKSELDRIRALGITPIPKLNFSTCHDVWLKEYSRMVSTPAYYRVCRDVITEVFELFGAPKLFHLGFDEETAGGQSKYQYSVIRQNDLWWHDAYFFFDVCEKLGTRPWIWGDYYWHHPEIFLERMPRSVLLSNWHYSQIRRNEKGEIEQPQFNSMIELDRAGYEQVPTSSTWNIWVNSLEVMQLCRDNLSDERLKGFMTAPWVFTIPRHKYGLLNDAVIFDDARRRTFELNEPAVF